MLWSSSSKKSWLYYWSLFEVSSDEWTLEYSSSLTGYSSCIFKESTLLLILMVFSVWDIEPLPPSLAPIFPCSFTKIVVAAVQGFSVFLLYYFFTSTLTTDFLSKFGGITDYYWSTTVFLCLAYEGSGLCSYYLGITYIIFGRLAGDDLILSSERVSFFLIVYSSDLIGIAILTGDFLCFFYLITV